MSQRAAQVSAETGDQPAWKERMAVALARDIVDGERVISGAHTEISFAAAMLAQKMHAPNIKLQLGGTCFLVNVTDLPVRLPKTSTDYRMIRWAEIAYDHMETFMYFGAPGGRRYYAGGRPPTNKYFVGDKFFAGGIQVDGNGNANMIGLKGEGGRRFKFRGPGTVGVADIVTVATPSPVRHAPRQAHTGRAGRLHLDARAQWLARQQISRPPTKKWIITPRAIFTFNKEGRAQLAGIFAGTTKEWVKDNTGFSFALAPGFSEVIEPTTEELAVLRDEIDPDGVLRH